MVNSGSISNVALNAGGSVNYTLPTNIDALFLYGGTQGAGNSDTAGDALYALDAGIAQTLTGNSPNDSFVVDNSADVVVPKAGSHDVVYAAASYTLPTGVDILILEAGTQAVGNSDAAGDALYAADAGIVQTLVGNSANDTFVVYNAADVVVPKAGSHDLVYSAVNYTLPTGIDSLILEGPATQGVGNSDAAGDTLYAANANQVATLTGNSHDDTFVVYNSADTVIGQAGSTDTVYAAANFTLPANVDTLFLEGTASQGAGNNDAVDTLYGNFGVGEHARRRRRRRYLVGDRHRRHHPDRRRRRRHLRVPQPHGPRRGHQLRPRQGHASVQRDAVFELYRRDERRQPGRRQYGVHHRYQRYRHARQRHQDQSHGGQLSFHVRRSAQSAAPTLIAMGAQLCTCIDGELKSAAIGKIGLRRHFGNRRINRTAVSSTLYFIQAPARKKVHDAGTIKRGPLVRPLPEFANPSSGPPSRHRGRVP